MPHAGPFRHGAKHLGDLRIDGQFSVLSLGLPSRFAVSAIPIERSLTFYMIRKIHVNDRNGDYSRSIQKISLRIIENVQLAMCCYRKVSDRP
jgi:hypothetical protein